MTTQEIANRYYELAQQGLYSQIQDELYDVNCISDEPKDAQGMSANHREWLEAIKAWMKQHDEMIEQMFGWFCNTPIVAWDFFACTMWMDVKYKWMERMNIEEVCVFGCKNGKIISEQFFY